jgi:hypothetical protein
MASVRLTLPTKDPKTEITVGLRSDRPIGELKASLIKKFETELLAPPVGSAGDGWVIALVDVEVGSLQVLSDSCTLSQFDLKPSVPSLLAFAFYFWSHRCLHFQVRIELKHRSYVAKIVLSDSSSKTVLLDRTSTVAELLRLLSAKFSVEEFALSFGLRRAISNIKLARDGDLSWAVDDALRPWLSRELTLCSQGISEAEELIFGKRFLGPWDCDERINAQNFQLAFWEARDLYLDGSLDSFLTLDICLEISSLLLLLTVGKSDPKLVSTVSLELAERSLPPQWRKRSDVLEKLDSVYSNLCGTDWATDIPRVRQRFIAIVAGFPDASSCMFPLPLLSFSNDTAVEPAVVVVDSSGIEFRSTRPSLAFTQLAHWADREKGPFSVYRVKMSDIVRLSVEDTTLSVCFSIYSQALVIACGQSARAKECIEVIGAFRHLVSLQTPSQPIPIANSSTDTLNFFDTLFCRNPSTVVEASSLAFESLKRVRAIFESAARLESTSTSESNVDNSSPTLTISQWFAQAATHLRGVVAGSASLCKGVLSGDLSRASNPHVSVSEVLKWGMELDSLAKCLLRGIRFGLSNSQALAIMTANLLLICGNILKSLSKLSSADVPGHSLKVQIVMLDRCLSTAASALDLALRGHFCDETTCLSLTFICRDIESSAQQLLLHCKRSFSAVSSKADQNLLENETAKCRSVVTSCIPLILICAFVDCSQSQDLLSRAQSSLATLSSSTKSLLSHLMEVSYKEEDKFSDAVTSARWYWGSLDHSLRMYYSLSATSELPSSDIDPMLPIPIFALACSIDRAFQCLGRSVEDMEAVEDSVSSVIRTLAKLVKIRHTADIVSISATLQSALRKQRPPKRGSRPTKELNPRERLFSYLQHLDISVDAVFRLFDPPAGRNDRLRFELRHALAHVVVLRSTLSLACLAPFDVTDFECISRHVEELDVLLHELLPVFSDAFAVLRSDPATDSQFFTSLCCNLDQLREHLDSITCRIRENSYFIGPFVHTVDLLISRLATRWDWCRSSSESPSSALELAPFSSVPRALTSPDLPIRRKSMSLTLRSVASSSFFRGTLSPSRSSDTVFFTPSSASRRASSPDDVDIAPISERTEGNIEITSEESLLSLMYNMVATGQVNGIGTMSSSLIRPLASL